MAFNLRGGRPKNMSQGAYWVQRHQADGRKRESAQASAARFDARYERITAQFVEVFRSFADEDGDVDVAIGSTLDAAMDDYNDLKTWIDRNID